MSKVIINTIGVVLLVIWGVVGFIFWFPFLLRMISYFSMMLLLSITNGRDIKRAEVGLDKSIRFYLIGFETIHSSMNNIISGNSRTEDIKQEHFGTHPLTDAVYQVIFALTFWALTVGMYFGWSQNAYSYIKSLL